MIETDDSLVPTWREMLALVQDELAEIAAGTTRRGYLPAEIEAKRQELRRLEALIMASKAHAHA